jgi:hypothetical protein
VVRVSRSMAIAMITISYITAREKEDMEKDRTTEKEMEGVMILIFLTEEKGKEKEKEGVMTMIFRTEEREKGKGIGAMMITTTVGREKVKEREKARGKVKDRFILLYLLVPTYRRLHQRYIQTSLHRLLSTRFDQIVQTEHWALSIQILVSSLAQQLVLGLRAVRKPALPMEARDLCYA